jgi:hypothetical protein
MTATEARGWLRRFQRAQDNLAAVDLCQMLDANKMQPDDMTVELIAALAALVNRDRGYAVIIKILCVGEPRTTWLRWITTRLQNRRDEWNDYGRMGLK